MPDKTRPLKMHGVPVTITMPDFGDLSAYSFQRVARELSGVGPAIRRAAAAFQRAVATVDPLARQAAAAGVTRTEFVGDPVAALFRVEVFVSGWETRYYGRGGWDPTYQGNPAALDVLVRRALRGCPEEPDEPLADLTQHSRARLAVAAIRGWVEKNPDAA